MAHIHSPGRLARRLVGLVTALAVLATVALGAGGAGAKNGAKGKVIKIGVLAPLVGDSGADGQEMVRGAQLAVDELNKQGGVLGFRFEVMVGNTENQKPDAVVSAIRRMQSDHDVHVIMTGYADPTNFEIDTMARLKMPYLISGGSAQTKAIIGKDPSNYPTVWSLTPTYDAYGTDPPRIFAGWAKAGKVHLANKSVYIVNSDNPYSTTIAEGLRKTLAETGWKLVGYETVPFGQVSDWGSTLAKIRAAKPSLIFNTDYLPANDATFIRAFVQQPTKSLLFIQYGPSVPEFLQLTKSASTGVFYDLLGGPIDSPKWPRAAQIERKFKQRYHVDSGVYGVALYEQVQIYVAALKKVKDPTDHLAIGKAIGQTRMDVAEGRLSFDPATHLAVQGSRGIPLLFYEIWHGKRILIEPRQYATGGFHRPPWLK
jgi:branched-chain amino acid transport system substrate-binding protein